MGLYFNENGNICVDGLAMTILDVINRYYFFSKTSIVQKYAYLYVCMCLFECTCVYICNIVIY